MSFTDYFFNIYTVVIGTVVLLLTLIHYKVTYYVWKTRGVNGPTPLPFIGTIYTAFSKDIPSLCLYNAKKYGRIIGCYEAVNPQLVISDPNVVKQVCIKDFHIFTNRRFVREFHPLIDKMISLAMDQQWKRLRKIISPTFSSGKIKRMKPLIEHCIHNATEFLETMAEKNELVDIKQFWSRFTLEVIACCCFATKVNSHKDPNNKFFKHVTDFFRPPGVIRMIPILFYLVMPTKIFKLFKFSLTAGGSLGYLSQITVQLMQQRRESKDNHNDFLQLLLEAEKEKEDKSEPPLTENEIIANCILFLAAGYETTANLLHWCSYALARHPEIQETLYAELNENITNHEDIDYDTAVKLPYLDAFLCETLRMYPPLVVADRTSSTEIELENPGIIIPAKTLVTISIYAMHHDPQFYPEPEQFKPDRFLGENRESINPYSYLPFGAGPRNCVAMRFALTEAKLALIGTLLKFKIVKSTKTTAKPIFSRVSSFLVAEPIFVNVVKR